MGQVAASLKLKTLNDNPYIGFVVETPPTYKQFIANMEEKMMDPEFTGDTVKLLRPGISYDPNSAWDLVREELIDLIR